MCNPNYESELQFSSQDSSWPGAAKVQSNSKRMTFE